MRFFPLHLSSPRQPLILIDLPIRDISYKWNQTVCGQLRLASFIWHNISAMHACCRRDLHLLLLKSFTLLEVPRVIHSPADGHLNCFHFLTIILDFTLTLHEWMRFPQNYPCFHPKCRVTVALKPLGHYFKRMCISLEFLHRSSFPACSLSFARLSLSLLPLSLASLSPSLSGSWHVQHGSLARAFSDKLQHLAVSLHFSLLFTGPSLSLSDFLCESDVPEQFYFTLLAESFS